jgi:hypothetical protein
MKVSVRTVAKSKIASLKIAVAVFGSLNESLGVDRTNRLSESLNISISAQVIHTFSGTSSQPSAVLWIWIDIVRIRILLLWMICIRIRYL